MSIEPLLVPFSMRSQLDGIHWVILGGESGNDQGKYRYRPSEVEWYFNLIIDCKEAKVAVFMKQLGTYLAKKRKLNDRHGGDINEWPIMLRVREFPSDENGGGK